MGGNHDVGTISMRSYNNSRAFSRNSHFRAKNGLMPTNMCPNLGIISQYILMIENDIKKWELCYS